MPSRDRIAVRPILRASPWFTEIDDREVSELSARAHHARYVHGETIFTRGGSSTGLLIPTSGRVRISTIGRGGSETLLALVDPGDLTGEVGALDGGPRTTNAVADGETGILTIGHRDLIEILDTHPETAMKLARKLCVHLRGTMTMIDHFALQDAGPRLLSRLLTIGRKYGEVELESGLLRIDHGLSQQDLADGSGLTRVSVNRQLGIWREQGLTETGRGSISIPDLDALEAFIWHPSPDSLTPSRPTTSKQLINQLAHHRPIASNPSTSRPEGAGGDPRAIHECLRASGLFEELGDEALGRLVTRARRIRYAHGDTIFTRRSSFAGYPFVLSGRVKHSTTARSGTEILLGFSEPGEAFGDIAAIDGGARQTHAAAEGATEIATISSDELNASVERCPKIAMTLLRRLCEQIRTGTAAVENLVLQDAGQRLLTRLLAIAKTRGEIDPETGLLRIDHGLSQRDLADSCGLTRVSVNRQLASWRSDGLVETGRGHIVIPDPDALEARVWKT